MNESEKASCHNCEDIITGGGFAECGHEDAPTENIVEEFWHVPNWCPQFSKNWSKIIKISVKPNEVDCSDIIKERAMSWWEYRIYETRIGLSIGYFISNRLKVYINKKMRFNPYYLINLMLAGETYLSSCREKDSLKSFINQYLGIPWSEK